MQNLPIDTSRITFIYSGKVVEKGEYAVLSNGDRTRTGNQAKNADGVPLWTVDVFPDDEEALRAEAVGVTVASWEMPALMKFKPVEFENLRATIYVDQRSGRANVSLKADGIVTPAKV